MLGLSVLEGGNNRAMVAEGVPLTRIERTPRRSLSATARDEHVVILAGDARLARIDLRPGAWAALPERLELGPDPRAPEFSRGRPVDGQHPEGTIAGIDYKSRLVDLW